MQKGLFHKDITIDRKKCFIYSAFMIIFIFINLIEILSNFASLPFPSLYFFCNRTNILSS